ncbi:NUDIX domain-containing protein [Thalassobius sp. S69A]|uniref:NUDIX domain-containing protein n=1 Tax=unclassified Thalassovita TaxID=2619711 RepID=UPI000C0DA4D7|nr:NUDIX hydrolase [Paracoccaceae bacterium]MBT27031.1 NUDIX hydrolase [Paracoccaceae bacterium]
MIRRFGDPRKAGVKYTRRPGAYALLPLGDSLLMTHQAEPWPEFQLPGGGIDPGEHPIEALHREILEETGWSVSRPRRVGAFRRFTYMPEYEMWAEKLCAIYIARPARQIAPPTEPGHTAVWVPITQAFKMLGNAGDRHFAALLASRAL